MLSTIYTDSTHIQEAKVTLPRTAAQLGTKRMPTSQVVHDRVVPHPVSVVPGLELLRTVLPQTILEKGHVFLGGAESAKSAYRYRPIYSGFMGAILVQICRSEREELPKGR